VYYGRDGPGLQSGKARDFAILKNIQSGSVAHPAFHSTSSGIIPRLCIGRGIMLITDIHVGMGEERTEL